MKRSTLKVLGLSLLIPGLVLGFLPIVAAYSALLNNLPAFELSLANSLIASLEHHGNVDSAVASPLVWAMAATGELILIWMHLTRPQKVNRYSVSPR